MAVTLTGGTNGDTATGTATTVGGNLVSVDSYTDAGTVFAAGETVTITEDGGAGVATATVATIS